MYASDNKSHCDVIKYVGPDSASQVKFSYDLKIIHVNSLNEQ
jgi:hypothetical protein